jgi:REP element-mobilizing transposase RayT
MANTYSQLLIHLVFAVKYRQALISAKKRPLIEKYISGIIKNRNHRLLAQYCMPDHIHILVEYNPVDSLSNLVRDIKSSSSKWINQNKILKYKFQWQTGFGAFSHSSSNAYKVINYINNQPKHHRKNTFQEEYIKFLNSNNIEFDKQYLFKDLN